MRKHLWLIFFLIVLLALVLAVLNRTDILSHLPLQSQRADVWINDGPYSAPPTLAYLRTFHKDKLADVYLDFLNSHSLEELGSNSFNVKWVGDIINGIRVARSVEGGLLVLRSFGYRYPRTRAEKYTYGGGATLGGIDPVSGDTYVDGCYGKILTTGNTVDRFWDMLWNEAAVKKSIYGVPAARTACCIGKGSNNVLRGTLYDNNGRNVCCPSGAVINVVQTIDGCPSLPDRTDGTY